LTVNYTTGWIDATRAPEIEMRPIPDCATVAFCAWLAAIVPASAADTKPDLTIKTKAIEATVTVDAALKAHPGLAADCLADGRRWAEGMRRDADKELRASPLQFRNGRWSVEREYASRSVVGRYVSILRSDYSNTGGAHPNTFINTILWDRTAKKRISIRPFLAESADNGPTMTALAVLVRAAVVAEKKTRDVPVEDDLDKDLWFAEIKPQLLKLGPVTLAPSTEAGKSSGFTFHFQPYAVGAYAEGPYTVFLPWTDFKAHLSAEGAAIFGGERAPGDDTQ
jgi:hypothetical protein